MNQATETELVIPNTSQWLDGMKAIRLKETYCCLRFDMTMYSSGKMEVTYHASNGVRGSTEADTLQGAIDKLMSHAHLKEQADKLREQADLAEAAYRLSLADAAAPVGELLSGVMQESYDKIAQGNI